MKPLALIIIAIALLVSLWHPEDKSQETTQTLNSYLKAQPTQYQYSQYTEYTYQQVGKTCYEDERNGQVIESHCN